MLKRFNLIFCVNLEMTVIFIKKFILNLVAPFKNDFMYAFLGIVELTNFLCNINDNNNNKKLYQENFLTDF
jgi:hypothetical protein